MATLIEVHSLAVPPETDSHISAVGFNLLKQVNPQNGTNFTLEECYKMLDCDMIEIVYPADYTGEPDSPIIVCDEESKLKSRPINPVATMAWGSEYDTINGHALLCRSDQIR